LTASFQHVERVPLDEQRGGIVQVFAGTFGGLRSPAPHYTGIFGGDLRVHSGTALQIPLEAAYEYAAHHRQLRTSCSAVLSATGGL